MRTPDVPLWGDRLAAIAAGLAYPPTPNLWPALQRQLSPGPTPGQARRGRGLAYALAALLLLLAVGWAVTPPGARAALLRSVRIGVVRIFLPEQVPTPTVGPGVSTPAPSPTPEVLLPPLDLAGLATLVEARQALGAPLLLPTYPDDLGPPDLVFVQDWDGPLVILVWTRADDSARARLALHILGPGTFAGKGEPSVIVTTEVNGAPALWTEGPHQLLLQSGHDTFRSLVTGNVLIWGQGGLTYRLETDGTLEEAVRIAESLR